MGPYEILVDQESAIQVGSDAADVFPIDEDHSNMVKFAQHSADYGVIAGRLRNLSESTIGVFVAETTENLISENTRRRSSKWKNQTTSPEFFGSDQNRGTT